MQHLPANQLEVELLCGTVDDEKQEDEVKSITFIFSKNIYMSIIYKKSTPSRSF